MVVFLIRTAIFLGSAALGLWIASLVLDNFQLTVSGFVLALLVFVVAQWILSPLIRKLAVKYADAFVGGVGLVSTFVALWVATLIGDGLTIHGVSTWILATLIVWLVTAISSATLPLIFLRNRTDSQGKKKLAT